MCIWLWFRIFIRFVGKEVLSYTLARYSTRDTSSTSFAFSIWLLQWLTWCVWKRYTFYRPSWNTTQLIVEESSISFYDSTCRIWTSSLIANTTSISPNTLRRSILLWLLTIQLTVCDSTRLAERFGPSFFGGSYWSSADAYSAFSCQLNILQKISSLK